MSEQFKVGCYGAGYFSQFHFDAWQRIDGAQLVAIANRAISNIPDLPVEKHPNVVEMLETNQIDVLDIITPPVTHLATIKTAIEFGVSAIICQKPFCEDLEQARQAVQLAKSAGIPIIVHENFRFQPWYRKMKEWVDQGKLGDVLQCTFRLRTGDGQGQNAYLDRQPYFREMERFLVHETAVHWIDTFRFLLGDPHAVYADLRRYNPAIAGEDAGYILFDHQDGKRSIFDGNRLLDHQAENCRATLGEALIEGTNGSLELHGDGQVTFRAFMSRTCETILEQKHYKGFAGDCVYSLQKHVIDGLNGIQALENEAEHYLKVIEIEEAIYQSALQSKKLAV